MENLNPSPPQKPGAALSPISAHAPYAGPHLMTLTTGNIVPGRGHTARDGSAYLKIRASLSSFWFPSQIFW